MLTLYDFIKESNNIENILDNPTHTEISAYKNILVLNRLNIADIENFVLVIAQAPIRNKSGMNVIVGFHHPPPGGPDIKKKLEALINEINNLELSSYNAHLAYEALHPFMDCNGRSGRIIWAWMRQREGYNLFSNPFSLGFLHSWYYQSLENSQ